MKKILSVVLAASLCLSLAACGSEEPAETTAAAAAETEAAAAETEAAAEETEAAEESADPIRVCVVYTGNLGDKSYNDSCNEGAQKAVTDFGIELKSLEGATAEEWESNLLAACEDGYDLVIGASSNIADYITEHGPNYPDTKFAVIDTTVDLPNVQSISFAQNEGSFLAGAAAAMFTEKTEIPGVNEDAIIGWVGGMDIPVLHDFFTGYEQGAKYINPDIQILQSFAGEWSNPLKGKELTFAQYDQGADIVMNVASDMVTSHQSIELAEKYPFIYGAVGVHPSDSLEINEDSLRELKELAAKDKIVAIGEIGLDYYWPEPSREVQKPALEAQIALAKEVNLPIVVHSRDAAKDTADMLSALQAGDCGGVIHCFSYGKEMAREFLNMGFYIGVGGVVTFKNAKKLKEAVEYTPMDRILLETDCPYLAPTPYRGKRNSSLYLPYVAEEIARIKNISYEEVLAVTMENAKRMYRI